MTTPFAEVPFLGGRSTLAVFRVGEIVCRVNPYPDPLAASLLLFLERAGFDGTPRFLGMESESPSSWEEWERLVRA